MAQGERGHIGIKKETTWGERVVGDNDFFLPFTSETLTALPEDLLSAAQRGVLDEPVSYQGAWDFSGNVVLEVHPTSIGHILRSALGAPAAASAAGSVETEVCDCETIWEHADTVIPSLDSINKKKGTYSSKLQVSAAAAVGVLASRIITFNFADPATTHYKFWLRCDIALEAADLAFVVSEETLGTEGAAFDLVNIPAMAVPGQWYEHTIAVDNVADMETAISVAIKMLVDKGEFTLWIEDIRAVVAGEAASAKQHIFTPMQLSANEFHADCPLFPYTFEVYRDQGDAFQFLGGVVNSMALNFSTTDKILKATCGVIAKNLGSVAATGLSLEATKPFVWENAVIKIGGSQNNNLESFGLTWNNNCIAKYFLNNSNIPGKIIRNGYRTIPVNFVIDFTDRTEYDYFIAGTERAFQIQFIGAVCEAGPPAFYYTLTIDLPLVRYLAWPINIGGPGRLTCAVSGKAKYDAAGWVLRATLINLKDTAEYAA